ncbi:MAG: hypothetical protein ACR2PM_13625 [Hyphomicrobiales bacterium]
MASETASRKACVESGGTVIQPCHNVCGEGSWPTEENRDTPPTDQALGRGLKSLTDLGPDARFSERQAALEKVLDLLKRYGAASPGTAISLVAKAYEVHRAVRTSREGIKYGNKLLGTGVSEFSGYSPGQRKKWAQDAFLLFMASMAETDGAVGLDHPSMKKLSGIVDELSGLGVDVEKFRASRIGGRSPGGVEFFERLSRAKRSSSSSRELEAKGKASGERFAGFLTGLVPTKTAGHTGPLAVAVEKTLNWTRDMFDASTRGLAQVRDAMKSGNLDRDKVAKVEQRLHELQSGPYSDAGLGAVVRGYVDDGSTLDQIAVEMFGP